MESAKRILMKAYRNKGASLSILKRNEEAIECFDKALVIDPDDYNSLYNKAFTLTDMGCHEEALEFYDKAIEITEKLVYPEIFIQDIDDELKKHLKDISDALPM